MSFDEFSITENQIKIEPENQAKNNGKIPNLVKYAKSSADDLPPSHINQGLEALQNFQKEYRVERYYAQNLGARLLYAHAKSIIGDDKELCQKYHRTITCMRRQIGCKHKIHRSIAHNKAFYSGLETCCNVWERDDRRTKGLCPWRACWLASPSSAEPGNSLLGVPFC